MKMTTKEYSGSFSIELSPESKETMAEWVQRKEADIAARELRTEDEDEDGSLGDFLFAEFARVMQESSTKLKAATQAMIDLGVKIEKFGE